LQIAARATPHFEGTGGIYICEGGESKRVFFLTAWHVVSVIPPNAGRNELYALTKVSQPCHDILLLGTKAFQDVLEFIMAKIGRQAILVDHYKEELKGLGEAGDAHDDNAQAKERKKFKDMLQEVVETVDTLDEFHGMVMKN
jgi:hypothetical protein